MPQLDNLGLKENPFINNNNYRSYYADQNRAQILESTEHLIEFSNNLQVIIGAHGMGKSHLLNTLAHRMDNNWRIARIQINEQVDTLSLIHEILDAFGGQINDGEELLEALENQLSDILQLGFKPVLFLDDAHYLSIDSIRFLLQLSQQLSPQEQDDEPYIKIVLFAAVEITENLQSPELRAFRDNIHIAHLEALDKEGVVGYLRHKLASVGFDRESPFTPRIIDSLFKDSQGIPEKIDFFANKFLVSSGKAEEYIEQGDTAVKPVSDENASEMSMQETDFQEDRIDKAEAQLNRLTEKFDEIEKLTEPSVEKDQFDKTITDHINDSVNDSFNNNESEIFDTFKEDNMQQRSVLSRLLIPGAIAAVVLLAIILINTIFDTSSDSVKTEPIANEKQVELLPLELPVQVSPAQDSPTQDRGVADKTLEHKSVSETESVPVLQNIPVPESENIAVKKVRDVPEISEPVDTTVPLIVETADKQEVKQDGNTEIQPDSTLSSDNRTAAKKAPEAPAPELSLVEPEPVIGSNNRQKIIIIGKNLQQDSRLIVSWGAGNKVFSARQTPEQWQYISSHKVRLELTTGIETSSWQVIAENANGQRSRPLIFDVVKPFIAKMSINLISPDPVPGNNKRQSIIIKGQGFTPQTVIELKWDKNNKHFSARLSPDQFEYISSNEIRLRINTGTKERKWKVAAKDPVSGAISTASFEVKNKVVSEAPTNAAESTSVSSLSLIKDMDWIRQQEDNHYTIQLFSSYEQQAIDRFVKKYALQGDIARFSSKRNGKTWFSLIYGSFTTKQAANDVIVGLHPDLRKTKPWIRDFASIKQQLSANKSDNAKIIPAATNPDITQVPKAVTKTSSATGDKIKDEAWIWTQSPADYTLQLVALSSRSSIDTYIRKYQLGSQAVSFKFIKNGKPLYVLIYGSYPNKASAAKAAQTLSKKITGSKPWVRNFADIHSMMTP